MAILASLPFDSRMPISFSACSFSRRCPHAAFHLIQSSTVISLSAAVSPPSPASPRLLFGAGNTTSKPMGIHGCDVCRIRIGLDFGVDDCNGTRSCLRIGESGDRSCGGRCSSPGPSSDCSAFLVLSPAMVPGSSGSSLGSSRSIRRGDKRSRKGELGIVDLSWPSLRTPGASPCRLIPVGGDLAAGEDLRAFLRPGSSRGASLDTAPLCTTNGSRTSTW